MNKYLSVLLICVLIIGITACSESFVEDKLVNQDNSSLLKTLDDGTKMLEGNYDDLSKLPDMNALFQGIYYLEFNSQKWYVNELNTYFDDVENGVTEGDYNLYVLDDSGKLLLKSPLTVPLFASDDYVYCGLINKTLDSENGLYGDETEDNLHINQLVRYDSNLNKEVILVFNETVQQLFAIENGFIARRGSQLIQYKDSNSKICDFNYGYGKIIGIHDNIIYYDLEIITAIYDYVENQVYEPFEIYDIDCFQVMDNELYALDGSGNRIIKFGNQGVEEIINLKLRDYPELSKKYTAFSDWFTTDGHSLYIGLKDESYGVAYDYYRVEGEMFIGPLGTSLQKFCVVGNSGISYDHGNGDGFIPFSYCNPLREVNTKKYTPIYCEGLFEELFEKGIFNTGLMIGEPLYEDNFIEGNLYETSNYESDLMTHFPKDGIVILENGTGMPKVQCVIDYKLDEYKLLYHGIDAPTVRKNILGDYKSNVGQYFGEISDVVYYYDILKDGDEFVFYYSANGLICIGYSEGACNMMMFLESARENLGIKLVNANRDDSEYDLK